MSAKRGLAKRLSRDFLLQALYIGLAAIVGVFAVSMIIQQVLVKQALIGEADFYWDTIAEKPDFGLPETKNMVTYRHGTGTPVPPELTGLGLGFHQLGGKQKALAYVSERNGEKLYQVFDSGQIGWLVTWFGLVPLAIALAVIYISLYRAFRVSSRALSPIVQLAEQVKKFDPSSPDISLFKNIHMEADTEIETLNSAMQDLTQRLLSFVERESNFTRDASHELRSPLTVIGMATDSMLRQPDLDGKSTQLLTRIKAASKDMEDLTDAFLLLARDSTLALLTDWVSVNEVIDVEIERTRLIFQEKNINIANAAKEHLLVFANEKVIATIIGNLIRNGVNYTDEGSVEVRVEGHSVIISDSGPGMDDKLLETVFEPFNRGENSRSRGGFGVGLTIVSRLCDRFGWPLSIDSTLGVGTDVKVSFPEGKLAD